MFKGRLFFSKLYWLLGVILYRLIFWSNLKKLHSILRFWFEKFNCIALSPFMKKDHNENYFYIYFLKIKILRAKSCTSQLWPKVNCRLCNWIARNLDHTQKFAKMSNVADWISGSFFFALKRVQDPDLRLWIFRKIFTDSASPSRKLDFSENYCCCLIQLYISQ